MAPVGLKPPVRSAASCSVPPRWTVVGLGVVVIVGLAGLTVTASSVTAGGAALLASPVNDTTQWYVPAPRLTVAGFVSKLPLADTVVKNDVPAIVALLESSSTKLRVPSPVYSDPPDSVARSWTVTGPAATAPVGCRMAVVRVGLALPTVNASLVTSGG